MRATIAATILLGGILAYPCARAEEPQAARPLYNTFSDEEEMAMGRSATEDTEKKYPPARDQMLDTYLDQVGQKIAETSRRPQLQYHFKLVNTSVMNAFSLPGGYVYVHRGLIEFTATESELVGVLAHEVGHIVAYHSMNDVSRRWLVDRVMYEGKKAGLLSDQQTVDVLHQYGGPILLFVDRKFSREEETEADLLGLYNAQRAGWDPNGLIAFLCRVSAGEGRPDLKEQLLRKHPLAEDRVDILRAELKQAPPSPGLTKDSPGFTLFKSRIRSLPLSPDSSHE